jgi:Family of unknown function (DUF5343)
MVRGSKHPYIPSGGMLVQTFTQLRKMFPNRIDAETLKRLSLAPKNESMIIGNLKFLGFIDEDGNKTEKANVVFLKHDDKAFASALETVIKEAYNELFNQTGERAWGYDRDSLIGFFRVHDETSALTAKRQAIAFETLASLAGYGETVTPKLARKEVSSTKISVVRRNNGKTKTENASPPTEQAPMGLSKDQKDFGLTVRIEINLPAQGDQETYDRIFESIRKNLLNG